MKCPSCGLYHPPQYDRCMSCGASMHAPPVQKPPQANYQQQPTNYQQKPPNDYQQQPASNNHEQDSDYSPDSESVSPSRSRQAYDATGEAEQDFTRPTIRKPARRSQALSFRPRGGSPMLLGILLFATVILVGAGATVFLLTKQPDDQRLYLQGVKELQEGQYAFAIKTLTAAANLRSNDPAVYLALARAYVGCDQVDMAGECVRRAQQLGSGVSADPTLASQLANYYRQRNDFPKAIDLLRPLAKADIPGKKAELADLDAAWGDEALRQGKVAQALHCWEEVRELQDGSRLGECEARLATIYQKLANTYAADSNKENDDEALKYLNKLNNIAQNPRNYEMAADLYEKRGQLELAIDQMRQASKLSSKNPVYDRKLAALLSRRGKELLDQGNTDEGYGYLQQAKTVSSDTTIPTVALRKVQVSLDRYSHMPQISGEIWNPTDNSVNALTIKAELFDNVNSRVLWTKDQRLVDEFVPPLASHESKPFEFAAGATAKNDGSAELRIYLNGTLYKSYPIGKKDDQGTSVATTKPEKGTRSAYSTAKRAPADRAPSARILPPTAPSVAHEQPTVPLVAPPALPLKPTPSAGAPKSNSSSAEEQTMKDLEQ